MATHKKAVSEIAAQPKPILSESDRQVLANSMHTRGALVHYATQPIVGVTQFDGYSVRCPSWLELDAATRIRVDDEISEVKGEAVFCNYVMAFMPRNCVRVTVHPENDSKEVVMLLRKIANHIEENQRYIWEICEMSPEFPEYGIEDACVMGRQ